jgi:hypothetical protein
LLCDWSRAAKMATGIAINPVCEFILFTFSLMAFATISSSIFDIPLPSTSQTPAWAIFHKPAFALSL